MTEGIQEIKENSIITKDGKERPIDCLIYGTGFVTDPRIYLKHFTCVGRNQIELKQAWKNGAESYYGIMTKNFPNLFQLVGPNTVLGHNSIIFMIESQVNYILQLIDLVEKSGQHAIEIKPKFRIPSMKEYKHNFKVLYGKLVGVAAGIKLPMERTFLYGQLIHGNIG